MVFVTHDQAESMVLADRVVVLKDGRVEQIGSPREVYEQPQSRFVSEFIGASNLLRVEVLATADAAGLVTVGHGGYELRCRTIGNLTVTSGSSSMLSIRPEKLTLHRARVNGGLNVWEGRVVAAAYYGDHREYELDVADQRLKVTTSVEVAAERGDEVFVSCEPREALLLPDAEV
jgi:ABC-type Fe3+/spermidine/putrescine transport system ATPase subunit